MLTNELIKKFPVFMKYNGHTLHDFEGIFETSRRHILSDVERLNDFLIRYQLPSIYLDNDKIFVPNLTITDLFRIMSPHLNDYIFQEERIYMIVIYLFMNQEFISNYHLQDVLRISKNSVLLDLKQLRELLKSKHVQISYNRQFGYHLAGSPLAIRQVLEWAISQLLRFNSGKWIIHYLASCSHTCIAIENMIQIFIRFSNTKHLSLVSERVEEVAYLLTILATTQQYPHVSFSKKEQQYIQATSIQGLVDTIVESYPILQLECDFIATRLLSCTPVALNDSVEIKIYTILDAIIDSALAYTGMTIENLSIFRKQLFQHLVPAYYRLLFGVSFTNPLTQQIMTEYHSLFYLVKKSLEPLSQATRAIISDDEVAYFTMHFGGYLVRQEHQQQKLRAICVCPSGISSSLIMKSELESLLPDVRIKGAIPLTELMQVDMTDIDMIFSTVFFEALKPVYIVQPLMNTVEKRLLKERIYKDFHLSMQTSQELERLLAIIEQHTTIKNREALENDLTNYLLMQPEKLMIEKGGINLYQLLSKDVIQCHERVDSWQEAIRLASQPLLDNQAITNGYVDAMIQSVTDLGAYIVLAPHVAVPHSNPKYGVNQLAMSLLRLAQPVSFDLENDGDEDKQVQLLFVLAAIDSSAHLKALQQLAMILDNDTFVETLINTDNVETLYQLIHDYVIKQEEGNR